MAYKLTSMKRGDEPQGRTLKAAMAGTSSTAKMPAMASPDVKPVKVAPKRRNAILAKATPEEIAANKTKSANYNYEDAQKRAKAVNKRREAGSTESQVKKADVSKEMKVKRAQFRKSYNAGTIESRSDLRDSMMTTFPKGTPAKEVRKAMPLSSVGRARYEIKKALKKGKKATVEPVVGLVKKVTTGQMNKGCPPKGQ